MIAGRICSELIWIGRTSADIPNTHKILATLLPMMFPSAIVEYPFLAATMAVDNSGKDVPTAISTSDIVYSGTPKVCANEIMVPTNKCAPISTPVSPMMSLMMLF